MLEFMSKCTFMHIFNCRVVLLFFYSLFIEFLKTFSVGLRRIPPTYRHTHEIQNRHCESVIDRIELIL